jgi:hypothetical protein
MTYSTLQTSTNNEAPVAETGYYANDDISVANRLAEYYQAQGIDPSAAYDSPDDAIGDFGSTFR